ncbi:hypothetical protein F5Y12DRAFT_792671 [Xylaria sp. FL1777]|nr:hypothetical protein F5Y12DRAFT_792671 [Xylaria sp. FL1777]
MDSPFLFENSSGSIASGALLLASYQRDTSIDTESIKSFPQFSKLPPELRFAVWRVLGLPSGPMYHYLCGDSSSHLEVPQSHIMQAIQVSQVNREARREVLQGRQLHTVRYGEGFTKPIFVNWDLDFFEIDPNMSGLETTGPEVLKKIKNVVVKRSAPFDWKNHDEEPQFWRTIIQWHQHERLEEVFASLKRFVLLLKFDYKDYVVKWRPGEYPPGHKFNHRRYLDLDLEPNTPVLPSNGCGLGLHTVDTTRHSYDWEVPLPCFESGLRQKKPFADWLHDAIAEMTNTDIVPRFFGPDVKFEMMM